MLSNDPTDLAKSILKDLGENGMGKITISPANAVTVEKFENPVEDQGIPSVATPRPTILSLVTNTMFSFWWMVITKFWWFLPVMLAALFLLSTPENMEAMTKDGITVGTSIVGAWWSFILASFASLIAPATIAGYMSKGGKVNNVTMVLLQLPAFYLCSNFFYNIALVVFLTFTGV